MCENSGKKLKLSVKGGLGCVISVELCCLTVFKQKTENQRFRCVLVMWVYKYKFYTKTFSI